jgi:hypothetical protein
MHYQGRGLGLHEQGILELVKIISHPKHQGLGYSTIRESKHINDTSIILGETLSNEDINMKTTNNPYTKFDANTMTNRP